MKNFKIVITLLLLVGSVVVIWKRPINLGLDLQGGMQLVLEAQDTKERAVDSEAIAGSMDVIRNRLNGMGTSEVSIRSKGQKQIVVEIPGVKDTQRALDLIGQTAQLEFVEAEWAPPGIEGLPKEDREVLIGEGHLYYMETETKEGLVKTPIILRNTVLTGANLKNALPGTSQYGAPVVNIEFDAEGSKLFHDITTKHTGKPLAILLDKHIISAPNINEPISGGKAQISGHFSIEEMRDLVIKLKAGALPVPVEIVSNKVIGPTLGQDSIQKSQRAFIIGFALVVAYMIFCYRKKGIVAGIALVGYVLISFATLKLFNATLTSPGIAGFILTIGMAVDANVIIFERIKEELAEGHSHKKSIERGFHNAFATILDSNITTLIGAGVLFFLGSGSLKGFAITLSIGILVSMFTAIILTRLLLDLNSEG